jgi:hypothetical protein
VAIECAIEIDYDSEEQARNVARSISLDNGKYADSQVHGNKLIVRCNASSTPSMLHTIEDLLACIKVADQLVRGRIAEGSDPDALADLDG